MRALLYSLSLLASPATAALYPLADLQARVEAFAGQPALIDQRLLIPDCARPDLAWAGGGRSVRVHCAAPEWAVFVGVGGAAAPVIAAPDMVTAPPAENISQTKFLPVIRRGDRVVVEAGGEGFVIGMETVADADSRDGRVALRAGGRRLTGVLMADGRVTINGLNGVPNGR